MDAGIAPPDALRVWVAAVVWPGARELPHLISTLAGFLQIDPGAGEALDLFVFVHAPTAQMVGTRDHAGRQTFGDPGMQHEIADLGMYFEEVGFLWAIS